MFKRHLLLNAAGGFGDGGSGGQGGSGDAGNGGAGNGNPANDNGNNDAPAEAPEWAKGWEGIEAELLSDPSLKAIQNPSALLKSYVHSQRQLGKKGVIIPTENSPKEEWDQFYQKVGVPLEEAKYKEALKFPEQNLGDSFNEGFLKLAHEARLQPNQAAKLYEYMNTQSIEGAKNTAAAYAEKVQGELNALRDEMGEEAYGVQLTKATTFLKENMGEDFLKFLGESGLGKNAHLVKGFMNLAKKFTAEGDIPSGDSTFGMTKADLEREINTVMGNSKDPYHNPSHPDHKRRVDEVQMYFKKLG